MVVIASAIYMLMPSLEGRANCPARPISHVHLLLPGTHLQRTEGAADHVSVPEQTPGGQWCQGQVKPAQIQTRH